MHTGDAQTTPHRSSYIARSFHAKVHQVAATAQLPYSWGAASLNGNSLLLHRSSVKFSRQLHTHAVHATCYAEHSIRVLTAVLSLHCSLPVLNLPPLRKWRGCQTRGSAAPAASEASQSSLTLLLPPTPEAQHTNTAATPSLHVCKLRVKHYATLLQEPGTGGSADDSAHEPGRPAEQSVATAGQPSSNSICFVHFAHLRPRPRAARLLLPQPDESLYVAWRSRSCCAYCEVPWARWPQCPASSDGMTPILTTAT
jgi:hypothetical protein